jgi:hypothetical protein
MGRLSMVALFKRLFVKRVVYVPDGELLKLRLLALR